MKYSFKYVLENRRDPNEGIEKKIADYRVVLSVVTKTLSPFPTYIFLNLGIKPDWVTLASILFIIAGAFLFVFGYVIWGVISILCFAILDSIDGDMARVVGTTSYGATLDSFGADFFYALIPPSLGYHLHSIGIAVGPLTPEMIFLISALVSAMLLLYRLIRTKHILFFSGGNFRGSIEYKAEDPHRPSNVRSAWKNALVRLVKFSRSTIIRNNFFAEPGMLLFFSLFSLLGWWEALALYFVILFLYNVSFLTQNFIHAYISFIAHEKNKKH